MQTYWITSRSLAVLVPALPDEAILAELKDGGEPPDAAPAPGAAWWWLTAAAGPERAESPASWAYLLGAFEYKMTDHDRQRVINGMAKWNGDDFGVMDPKVQTITEQGVAFRATPQSRCHHVTRPPPGSFMPVVLPPVPAGFCVLEVTGLSPDTEYRLALFSIADGSQPPERAPAAPEVEVKLHTIPAALYVERASIVLKVASGLAMLVGLAWQLSEHRAMWQRSTYNAVPLARSMTVGPAGASQQVIVRDHMLGIVKDLVRSLTMFLPILGPVGFVLASDVLIGVRIKSMAAAYKMQSVSGMVKHSFNLVVNACIIPLNIYSVQMIWFTYGIHWLRLIGLSSRAYTSYSTFERRYNAWLYVTGLEYIGWLPGIVLSALMLAVEQESGRMLEQLRNNKHRVEEMLNQTPKGGALYKNLCDMEKSPFGRNTEPLVALERQLACLGFGILFGLLPHLWMCVRHGVPLWNGPMAWVTVVYVVNIAGVSARFLVQALTIVSTYERNCQQMAVFQALSWKEDHAMAIYDPFIARNDDVVRVRVQLKESVCKIAPLRLEDPVESKIWWHLREVMLIDMKECRGQMETMVLISILLSWFAGLSDLALIFMMKNVSATTLVSAAMLTVLVFFTYKALGCARDINLMCEEHTSLLHNVVAEANMPLRPLRPLDSHLQQERFLLQLATLIERQPAPETIASFSVTPQLFSTVMGSQGVLLAAAIWNLAKGILQLSA